MAQWLQVAMEQQDDALDRIEMAAQRVGQLGLEINRELGVRNLPAFFQMHGR